MINLRYHIVSIVAVFLALGIGTALGGTLLDRYTVDLLNQSISSAEARIKTTEKENRRLDDLVDAERERNDALIASSSSLLGDQLEDIPVLIVSAPGVELEKTKDLQAAVTAAGADPRGVLMLQNPMNFQEDQVDEALADAVGEDPRDVQAVRTEVLARLGAALSAAGQPVPMAEEDPGQAPPDPSNPGPTLAPDSTTTTVVDPGTTDPDTTEPVPDPATPQPAPDGDSTTTTAPAGEDEALVLDGTQPAIIDALFAADYARLVVPEGQDEPTPILAEPGYRYVFLTEVGLDEGADAILLDVLTADDQGAALPVVVGAPTFPPTASDDQTSRTAVAAVRDDPRLAELFSTVDDVDMFSGLVAVVLALDDIDRPVVGHYGQGDGATAVLPPPR